MLEITFLRFKRNILQAIICGLVTWWIGRLSSIMVSGYIISMIFLSISRRQTELHQNLMICHIAVMTSVAFSIISTMSFFCRFCLARYTMKVMGAGFYTYSFLIANLVIKDIRH